MPAMRQKLLDFADRLGWIEILGACLGTVHDGVAAIQAERILEAVEPLTARLVAAVDDPAIGRQQGCRTQVPLAVPPVTGTAGRAAGAQNARGRPIHLFLIL